MAAGARLSSLRRGRGCHSQDHQATELGPLADLADAAKGPTTKLKEDLQSVAGGLLLGADKAKKAAEERRALLEQRRGGQQAAPAPPPAAPPAAPPAEVAPPQAAVEEATADVPPPAWSLRAEYEAQTRRRKDGAPADGVVEVEVEAATVEGDAGAVEVEAEVVEVQRMRGFDEAELSSAGSSRAGGAPAPAGGAGVAAPSAAAAAPLATVAGSAGAQEAEIEALDVGVVAEEGDREEEARERKAKVLDAALVVAELNTGTLLERTFKYLTPEGARAWEPLRAFRAEEERERRERADRAEEVLLDGFAEVVKRK